MKRIIEIILAVLFVGGGTYFAYSLLSDISVFWNEQTIWSIILAAGWVVVALGYVHQGWLVRRDRNSDHVSMLLPAVVFLVQCVLFVKGVHYDDWSLIAGAIMVNSGVTFNLYQIYTNRRR
jgi:hypothetical protein